MTYVFGFGRGRTESSTTVCSCQRPSWTPCERYICLVETRGLAMGCPECVVRCRTARDLDLLIPSRAPSTAPGTMTCSREQRERLFYGCGLPSTQSSRRAVGSSGAQIATLCERAPHVACTASGRRAGGLRGEGSVLVRIAVWCGMGLAKGDSARTGKCKCTDVRAELDRDDAKVRFRGGLLSVSAPIFLFQRGAFLLCSHGRRANEGVWRTPVPDDLVQLSRRSQAWPPFSRRALLGSPRA